VGCLTSCNMYIYMFDENDDYYDNYESVLDMVLHKLSCL
jgi:hypothetical protein